MTVPKNIDSFSGEYRWLSNFWHSPVVFEGMEYPSVEHAYQAAKTLSKEERKKIQKCSSAGKAKKEGQDVSLRSDWTKIRLGIMRDLLIQKFQIPDLRERLLVTKNAELIEGNYWHDNFFGSCKCVKCGDQGENHLGKLLMEIRDEIGTVK